MVTAPGHYGPTGSQALNLLIASLNDGSYTPPGDTGALLLNQAAFGWFLGTMTGNLAKDGVNFAQLPTGTQSAISDYAWNAGPGSLLGTGSAINDGNGQIMTDLQTMNWVQLAADLEAIGKATNNGRYIAEAAKITADIQAGKLPKSGTPC